MKNTIPPIERNPINVIMELEQEPKDMDTAFKIGSMTKNNNRSNSGGKKTVFDTAKSLCLIRSNSMSSSMMFWFGCSCYFCSICVVVFVLCLAYLLLVCYSVFGVAIAG